MFEYIKIQSQNTKIQKIQKGAIFTNPDYIKIKDDDDDNIEAVSNLQIFIWPDYFYYLNQAQYQALRKDSSIFLSSHLCSLRIFQDHDFQGIIFLFKLWKGFSLTVTFCIPTNYFK